MRGRGGLGFTPKMRCGYPNAMLAKPSASRWGLLGPSFVPGGEKTGWESESCYDSLLEEPLLPFFKKQREIPAVSTEICYNKNKTLPVSGGGRGIQCQQF